MRSNILVRYFCGLMLSIGFPLAALNAQDNSRPAIIAYYTGHNRPATVTQLSKITHIIYSFCHLRGNRIHIRSKSDSAAIRKLVDAKKQHPRLKVLLALGGWGGCKTCSTVFASEQGRTEFAESVSNALEYFRADGLDLDWEYPAIPGYPGHPWQRGDKDNFTALLQVLRKRLGTDKELSFAAGAYYRALQQSIDWADAARYVDRIHLMTYDLRSSRHNTTGHHAPLFSTSAQEESADFAVRYLQQHGVPLNKIVIGAAFYGRIFNLSAAASDGLFEPGKFSRFIQYRSLLPMLKQGKYRPMYDSTAQAAFAISADKSRFVTYENISSVQAKARYVLGRGLAGLMFWELSQDTPAIGFVDAIHDVFRN